MSGASAAHFHGKQRRLMPEPFFLETHFLLFHQQTLNSVPPPTKTRILRCETWPFTKAANQNDQANLVPNICSKPVAERNPTRIVIVIPRLLKLQPHALGFIP